MGHSWRMVAVILVAHAGITAAPAAGQVFRGTDERGQVHITDDPNNLRRPDAAPEPAPPPAPPPPPARRAPAPSRAPAERPAEQPPRSASYRGRIFVEWVTDLRSPSAGVRQLAAEALPHFGVPAVLALAEALEDPAVEVRLAAAQSLVGMGPVALPAVPALMRALGDGDRSVRLTAGAALLRAGGGVREALTSLAYDTGGPGAGTEAARAVVDAAIPARTAEPGLVEALRDRDSRLRAAAPDLLARIQPPSTEAVAALARALSDPAPEVQVAAANALRRLGSSATAAVPALLGASETGQGGLRRAALDSLAVIVPGSRELVAALTRALDDPLPTIRAEAIRGLGQAGPAARQAVVELRRVAEREPRLGSAVADSIRRIEGR